MRKINSTATAIETQNFTYDTLDRLITANATGGPATYSESYTYNATTGNLATKGSLTLQYNNSAHVHAVTNAGSNTYSYDANGNQITRVIGGQTYTLSYNAENQLVGVTGPSMTASFVYDGGGARVKSTTNGTTTYFPSTGSGRRVGGHYEVTGSQITKYYFAGAQRIAMRKNGTLSYMVSTGSTHRLTDHLGSTTAITNTSGALTAGTLYKAWGEVRYSLGASPTKYTYTGQYSNVSDFGLMFYNARWYDPVSGRFAQADTIVPQNIQGWDHYSYTFNNPIRYIDPSGHIPKEEICKYLHICGKNAENKFLELYGNELHDLLWDTDVTWGDKLEWEQDGELQVAMMVLFTTNGSDYNGVLWGIEGNFVGKPMQFSVLDNADRRDDGRTSVQYSALYPQVEAADDLPMFFPLPEGAYDGNIPYMHAKTYANYPEGTVILGIASAPFILVTDGVPVIVSRAATALGVTDVMLTWIGATQSNLPYWFNDLFGSSVEYPAICMASSLSGSC